MADMDIKFIGWWVGFAFLIGSLAAQIMQAAYTPGSLALDGILVVILSSNIPDRWPFNR